MKSTKLLALVPALLVVVGLYAGSQAKGETSSVAGWLQKGDEPNEYGISGAEGKTYEMRSSEAKLPDHLGYKVTVTGRLRGETDEDEENAAKNNKKEAGYIQVTKLTKVSFSCQ